jgi:hypothetical protein
VRIGEPLNLEPLTDPERRLLSTVRWAIGPVSIADLMNVLAPYAPNAAALRSVVYRLRAKLKPGVALLPQGGAYYLQDRARAAA